MLIGSCSVLLRRLKLASLACAASFVLNTGSLQAEGLFRNRDNPSAKDYAEGTYPAPCQRPHQPPSTVMTWPLK
jgi:hypothetical protein